MYDAQEQRLRRKAARHFNLRLERSRIRNPDALGYGGYMLIDIYGNYVVQGGDGYAYSATIDQIEAYLLDDDEQAAA